MEADVPLPLSPGIRSFPIDKNHSVCNHYMMCLLFWFFLILEGPDPESDAKPSTLRT